MFCLVFAALCPGYALRMDVNEYTLRPTDVARMLGVHRDTVVRWADAGRLNHWRTPTGQRRFREADVIPLMPAVPSGAAA